MATIPLWQKITVGAGFLGAWAYGLTIATNYQRATSPLVRNVLFALRTSPEVKEILGEDVRNGYWFTGTINNFKGRANLDFMLKGSLDSGEIHLEAVRRDLEWRLVKLELTREGKGTIDLRTIEDVQPTKLKD